MTIDEEKRNLDALIAAGIEAKKTDIKKQSDRVALPEIISGEKSEQFINESIVFTKRHLSDHELKDKLLGQLVRFDNHVLYYDKILSILKSIQGDEEYWESKNK